MAWEAPVQNIPGGIAGADFSGATGTQHGYQSTGQFLITKLSGDNTHVPCAAVTDQPSGIAQTNPLSGDALTVMHMGISKVVASSGGLVAGEMYGPDANGAAEPKTVHSTGRDSGEWYLGQVLIGAVAGALATVTVQQPVFIE